MKAGVRLADVMLRPGMYGIRTFEQALAFFNGFDAATESAALDGFREWLARHGGDGPNLSWDYQATQVVARRLGPDATDADRLQEFFRLVREFQEDSGRTPAVSFDDARILARPDAFAPEWLAEGGKAVVPVATPSGLHSMLLEQLRDGALAVDASEVLECLPDADPVPLPLDRPFAVGAEPVLLILPDHSGAVLGTGLGYALVAGTPRFLAAVLPGGADHARAEFGRVARKVPRLAAVAGRFPPRARAWRSPDEVPPGTATAEQLALMAAFGRGELPGGEFATRWYAARRLACERDERVRDRLAEALHDVFFLLEDYPIDPALREPGDVTDEELETGVRAALDLLG
jgi:hypothetical protein